MERKWIIAIVIIAIIVVGGLGWYFFFGMPQEQPSARPIVYIDAQNYTMWTSPWVINGALPNVNYTSISHNVTNAGTDSVNVKLNFTAQFYNVSQQQWVPIYDGKNWLYRNLNITVSTLLANGAKSLGYALANKTNEQAFYSIYLSYTDQVMTMTFQYSGVNPTIDGHTVFTYIAFDGNGNSLLDGADKAFNFTNNLDRISNQNVLDVYTPEAGSWKFERDYRWNDTLPNDMPVTVVITSDRKTITWTIPFSVIGAEKEKTLGLAWQAFSHDWDPGNANAATPSRYNKVKLLLTETSAPLTLNVAPQTTINFYIKVRFLLRAKFGNYTFTFQPYIP